MVTAAQSSRHAAYWTLTIATGLATLLLLLLGIPGTPRTRAQTHPTLASVAPDTLIVDSAETFTLTGSEFEPVPTVTVGSQVLPDAGFVNSATLMGTLPLGFPMGLYTVTVTNPDGLGDGLAAALTVRHPTPTLASITPTSGLYGQALTLTITGTHFAPAPTVRLDGTPCPTVRYVNSTTLRAEVPASLAPDIYDLTVVNPGPERPQASRPDAFTLRSPTPAVAAIAPSEAPNNLDTAVVITGTGFVPTPTLTLGGVPLDTMDWVSATRLAARVPWGMDPGAHDLSVANPGPGEPSGSLPDAFTATRAIGVWTSGGPYGGMVQDVAVSPVTSRTAFAAAGEGGLFRTQDGGDHWTLVNAGLQAFGVSYGPAPAHALYHWGFDGGLRRSQDGGETWMVLSPEPIQSFAVNPQNDQELWVTTGHGDLRFSDDGGAHWELRIHGLPEELHFGPIAVHPITPSIAYVGTSDGHVFRTVDSGLNWASISEELPESSHYYPAATLAIDPFATDTLLFSRFQDYDAALYRTTDGGETWAPVIIGEAGSGSVTDLAFSPHDPGVVYASGELWGKFYVSTDSGQTWRLLCQREGDCAMSVGLDPTTGLPAYLGGAGKGVWRVTDDQACELATHGITGLVVTDVEASQTKPETVFVSGGYASENGGHSWRSLRPQFPEQDPSLGISVIMADPQSSDAAYLAGFGQIYYTPDGETIHRRGATPDNRVNALAVTPMTPTILYAGGVGDAASLDHQDVGKVFRSLDGGYTWTQLDVGRPISQVAGLLVDPVHTQTLYMATRCGFCRSVPQEAEGLGIFRSEDGGGSWRPLTQTIGHLPVTSLAMHPADSQILYAGVTVTKGVAFEIFRTEDGGDTWASMHFTATAGTVNDIVLDPLAPDTVYAGAANGLYRHCSDGEGWTRAAGQLGEASIRGLAAASFEDRTLVYVATTGVTYSSQTLSFLDPSRAGETDVTRSGVYQQTIRHLPLNERVYLPLVVRDS